MPSYTIKIERYDFEYIERFLLSYIIIAFHFDEVNRLFFLEINLL